jgi:hypothetical protein
MRFFFPDSQDLVDPSFDFVTEERSIHRVRQRDDQYPHEALYKAPYDGVLLSRAIVVENGRFTMGQRQRLSRRGVRSFFRLDRPETANLRTMGDCGAFAYVDEPEPPVTVDEVAGFYDELEFDYGVSVDHIITAYRDEDTDSLPGVDPVPPEWKERRAITLQLAEDFRSITSDGQVRFEPIGVAQGWSPSSYADSVKNLQKMGYRYIGLGGLVPLKTPQILSVLSAVKDVKDTNVQMHLFGVTRVDHLAEFASLGATSFDSTSPLRRAFMDERDNYYTPERTYMAVRVPQVDGNPSLKRRILAGEIDQDEARRLERGSLEALTAYDKDRLPLNDALEILMDYQQLFEGKRERLEAYGETLADRPWKRCQCGICDKIGIHVVLFRGAERNRRRGFHNLFVVNEQKQAIFAGA